MMKFSPDKRKGKNKKSSLRRYCLRGERRFWTSKLQIYDEVHDDYETPLSFFEVLGRIVFWPTTNFHLDLFGKRGVVLCEPLLFLPGLLSQLFHRDNFYIAGTLLFGADLWEFHDLPSQHCWVASLEHYNQPLCRRFQLSPHQCLGLYLRDYCKLEPKPHYNI